MGILVDQFGNPLTDDIGNFLTDGNTSAHGDLLLADGVSRVLLVDGISGVLLTGEPELILYHIINVG